MAIYFEEPDKKPLRCRLFGHKYYHGGGRPSDGGRCRCGATYRLVVPAAPRRETAERQSAMWRLLSGVMKAHPWTRDAADLLFVSASRCGYPSWLINARLHVDADGDVTLSAAAPGLRAGVVWCRSKPHESGGFWATREDYDNHPLKTPEDYDAFVSKVTVLAADERPEPEA